MKSSVRCSVVVSTMARHARDPGSTPGGETMFFQFLRYLPVFHSHELLMRSLGHICKFNTLEVQLSYVELVESYTQRVTAP